MIPYLFATAMLLIGLYAIVARRNLIKIAIGVVITEYAVNLFLILLGYRAGGIPPILSKGMDLNKFAANSVDPLPQALTVTSIVIGLGVMALLVALVLRLYEKYGTLDESEIKRLKG